MDRSNPPSGASRPAPWLGRLLIISLLVMLNLPAVLTGATGMDQYGFFTLEPVAVRPWPLALSIALSAASAGAGYLAYRLLQRRAWFAVNRYEAYHRNAVIFGTPVAIAFLPVFFLTGYGNKPLVLGVAGIMATSLCLIAALNDHKIRIDAGMARTLFVVCAAIILVLLTLSVSGMLAMYFIEHSPSGGNFFWAWEFAWSDLGYPAEEFNQRHRNGLLAFGVAGTCYMTVALGGSLLGAVLRWAEAGPEKGAVPGTAAAGASRTAVAIPGMAGRRRSPVSGLADVYGGAEQKGIYHQREPVRKPARRKRPPSPRPAANGKRFPSEEGARGLSCCCVSMRGIREGGSLRESWRSC